MTPAAVAVIRAAALRNNLQTVREAAPGCRVLAVIKANAYGHGLVPVARISSKKPTRLPWRGSRKPCSCARPALRKRIVVLGGFVDAEEARLIAASSPRHGHPQS